MAEEKRMIQGRELRILEREAVVVGTGAAGYNAASCLKRQGVADVLMVTEGVMCGTSRNSGSDKQTYYKLSLAGEKPDSVRKMAADFFSGLCVDGDMALCEAALSAQCFFRLADLGVRFPHNRYGEYVGYQTDHDTSCRATSAGPYTSRMMTQALEQEAAHLGIPVWSGMQVIRILYTEGRCCGILCLDLNKIQYVAILTKTVIYATGGPSGMYRDSVYPLSQSGATGLAFEAGVRGKNLTEWQFGLASLSPRWNVSGTYMQALPRFVSANQNGEDEREFLQDYFNTPEKLLSCVFLKGYQWPFDVDKAVNGSSVIDLYVYKECCERGRRVFLDFRSNPGGREIPYSKLCEEASEYLKKAKACFGTPYERLAHMNNPAVEFYRDHGVDLEEEMLEVAVCAQHNNGGLSTDCWWQTNLSGFFAVGEVCGSHGVRRPGGSALNAGQVGAERAARYAAKHRPSVNAVGIEQRKVVMKQIEERIALGEGTVRGMDTLRQYQEQSARGMSRVAGMVRNKEELGLERRRAAEYLKVFGESISVCCRKELGQVYRYYDILLCQYVYLSAMADYVAHGGRSRGSALYQKADGKVLTGGFSEKYRFDPADGWLGDQIQEIALDGLECRISWRPVRPIPTDEDFFEMVWKSYREMGNID